MRKEIQVESKLFLDNLFVSKIDNVCNFCFVCLHLCIILICCFQMYLCFDFTLLSFFSLILFDLNKT